MPHWVYIVRCQDGTLYTGYTTDLDRRLREHNGEIKGGARYTRGRGPVTLVHREEHGSMAEALRREAAIKRLSRNQKERLAAEHQSGGPGRLLVCATPIGNLADITLRVLQALREADLVAAEDTRQTLKLLTHYQIRVPLTSYHQHNRRTKGPAILAELLAGKIVALVSDAGLPGISDPGEDLIAEALAVNVPVEVLPGPSAALTALVGSGLPTSRFAFEGFLPRAGVERKKRFAELAKEPRTVVLYEAPHRLLATLTDLLQALGDRRAAAARELTKRYEEVRRGRLDDLLAHFQEEEPRGEFTLVIEGSQGHGAVVDQPQQAGESASPPDTAELARRVQILEEEGLTRKEAMKRVAAGATVPRRDVYRAYLAVTGRKK